MNPPSLTDAYALIKVLHRSHGVRRFRILANMSAAPGAGEALFRKLERVTSRFLDGVLDYASEIPEDSFVRAAIREQRCVVQAYPSSPAARAFARIARQASRWQVQQGPARQCGILHRTPVAAACSAPRGSAMNQVSAYSSVAGGASATVLVGRHAELVKRIAYHLAGRLPPSVEVDDLIQAGMIGLLEAATHYASDRGASFETYAGHPHPRRHDRRLRKQDWAPRSVHRKSRAAASAIREIEGREGREARDTEIAAAMGIPLDEYHRIVQDSSACQLSSMDEVDDAAAVADREANPLLETESGALRSAVAAAIAGLPERERLVMSMYYDDELNLKEIGAVLGISESRVCQLHGQALVRLRARLRSWQEERPE